jgi:hypothetical protein
MIEILSKVFEILFNVLFKRGVKNFFCEIKDLLFVDFRFKSLTFLRKKGKKQNYVPYYSCILKKNIKTFLKEKKINDTYFVDLGSGKGRVLLGLSDLNFKKLIGVEKNKFFFKESSKYIKKNFLSTKIEILNKDFIDFNYIFTKNSNLVFFWYGVGSKILLKKILVNFKKKFKDNKIFFFIIPEDDIPKDLKNIKVLFTFRDFKNDLTRNSKIITLL